MCRLVAYLGQEILLSDVLVKPKNSLVLQSLHAKESDSRTNGDGFGLGWYVPSLATTPALFTSVFPAWSNQNLLHLTDKVKSPAFFGHVRAASAGGVTQTNCHPFIYHEWMMMHNGTIAGFTQIKRHVRRLLDDDLYDWVKGGTDSEHLFALFLQRAKKSDLSKLETIRLVLEGVIHEVLDLVKQFAGKKLQDASYLNLCLTDGKQLLAIRYCSDAAFEPRSLHYAVGQQFVMQNGHGEMQKANGTPKCVLVSSEKLTESDKAWQIVPPQHALLVTEKMDVVLKKMT
ncbi:MAG: class II glutamine amidotransferase [Legionella sp.]|nr:class II glutamine amidotransferase [Legionella sp.]